MSRLTPKKIKAARALLGWSQTVLANKTTLSMQTIKKLESSDEADFNLGTDTASKIFEAFLSHNVTLTDKGVEYIEEGITRLEGQEGFLRFRQDLYDTLLLQKSSDILVSNVDERDFVKWQGGKKETDKHTERMNSLKNLKMRIMIQEGDTNFVASEYAEYRWMPKNLFTEDAPFYIYGNKTAMIKFFKNSVEIIIVNDASITNALRQMLNNMWELSSEPK